MALKLNSFSQFWPNELAHKAVYKILRFEASELFEFIGFIGSSNLEPATCPLTGKLNEPLTTHETASYEVHLSASNPWGRIHDETAIVARAMRSVDEQATLFIERNSTSSA